ncbi:MAG TPA: hypothetical protein VE057_02250 [Archangium sp.]|nr:hypothetical protein [Archangium sp.]
MSSNPPLRIAAQAVSGIAITGLGMVSPIGLDVISSCAAARAGLSRRVPLDLKEADVDTLEDVPLKGHLVRGLTDGFDGMARLLLLGEAALTDLLEHAALQRTHLARTGFLLNLPGDFYELAHLPGALLGEPTGDEHESAEVEEATTELLGARDAMRQRVLRELLSLVSLPIPVGARGCFKGGAAAFVSGLAQAVGWLQTRTLDRCILGGIDSFSYGAPLSCVHELGLTRSLQGPVGFFPGEAAAFVLLERVDAARARGAQAQAFIGPYAAAAEEHHRFSGPPPAGAALFDAVASCFAALRPPVQDVNLAIVNLNGDDRRARDFGTALVRMSAAGLPSSFRQWYPPESFGEIGAATGPVSICLGARGFARNYASTSSILVSLLDDDENRGAFFMEAPHP